MAATKTILNGQAYLWQKKGSSPRIAVISSHGGEVEVRDNFSPGIPIGFYQRVGEKLIATLDTALARPVEVVKKRGTCEEYTLEKFQGYHGDNSERYRDIEKFVDAHAALAVVTVRNRKRKHVTLSAVVTALNWLGFNEVRALFCRVYDPNQRVEVLPKGFRRR